MASIKGWIQAIKEGGAPGRGFATCENRTDLTVSEVEGKNDTYHVSVGVDEQIVAPEKEKVYGNDRYDMTAIQVNYIICRLGADPSIGWYGWDTRPGEQKSAEEKRTATHNYSIQQALNMVRREGKNITDLEDYAKWLEEKANRDAQRHAEHIAAATGCREAIQILKSQNAGKLTPHTFQQQS